MTTTAFESVIPVLRVENLAVSIAYYVEKLGFAVLWQGPVLPMSAAANAASSYPKAIKARTCCGAGKAANGIRSIDPTAAVGPGADLG